MSRLTNFKRQHREIRELISTITPLLDRDLLLIEPTQVRYKLSALLGKLMMHLAMEDRFLYPRLIKSKNRQIQTTANRFSTEMGDLVKVFNDYSKKWLSSSSIRANPDAFIEDSHDTFRALLNRVDLEDLELYPLVEEAG